MIKGKEVNSCVRVAVDKLALDAIACVYLGHHQMVHVIIEENVGEKSNAKYGRSTLCRMSTKCLLYAMIQI